MMLRMLRDVRLIPVVLAATAGLFVLKTTGIVFDGGYTLRERLEGRHLQELNVTDAPAGTVISGMTENPRQSWASSMFNYPDVTGSVPDTKSGGGDMPLKVASKPPPEEPKPDAKGIMPDRPPSPGEKAILERLGDRRQEIEARNREIDMRESLLKAAEKRVEARVAELKELEDRVNGSIKKRDEAEANRFKSLVSMYENMKPKDAARIFDRLDQRILVEVATQMNPRRLSDVLAAMASETAERLTVELANRAGSADKMNAGELPKIDGKPAGG